MHGGNKTSQLFKNSYYGWNSSGGTNQACVQDKKAAGEDWKCIFAEHVTPYIKSEMFVMQNLYDSWQINNSTYCAVAIRIKALGPDHGSVGTTYNNMAVVLKSQGKLDEAMVMYQKALAIKIKASV